MQSGKYDTSLQYAPEQHRKIRSALAMVIVGPMVPRCGPSFAACENAKLKCHFSFPQMVVKRKANTKSLPLPMEDVSMKDEDIVLFEARNIVAIRCDDENEPFFVGELLDDILEDMLDNVTACVNLIYYDKQPDGTYCIGNYDSAPVRAIICEIELHSIGQDAFAIPSHHRQRVRIPWTLWCSFGVG